MKERLSTSHKGFILIEALLAFSLITVSILLFQRGAIQYLLASETEMEESQMYRTLYEEVRGARKNETSMGHKIIERNNRYEVQYRLEARPYVQIKTATQQVGIYREE